MSAYSNFTHWYPHIYPQLGRFSTRGVSNVEKQNTDEILLKTDRNQILWYQLFIVDIEKWTYDQFSMMVKMNITGCLTALRPNRLKIMILDI